MTDASSRALLLDLLDRIEGLVVSVTTDLSEYASTYRPNQSANSVAWLLWHQSRILDDHVADLAGTEQVWLTKGWEQRFGLPFDAHATGFGHRFDDVAAVRVGPDLLAAYHRDADEQARGYVDRLDADELDRVVDTRWDPPVTAGARLVSVVSDCLQHLGQASYVRGLADDA